MSARSMANRIFGVFLCFVLSIGVLPAFASSAEAAEPIQLSGNSFTTDPGQGFTMQLRFVCDDCPKNGGNSAYVYPGGDALGHSFAINSFSYSIANGHYNVSFSCSGSSCHNASLNWTYSTSGDYDCSRYLLNGWNIVGFLVASPNASNPKDADYFDSVSFMLDRDLTAHQGNPTCITSDTCALCGASFTDPANHERPDEFVYAVSGQDAAKHDKKLACCGQVVDTLSHSLLYSSDGDAITEACSADCGHAATARLDAQESYVYTGEPIVPSAVYSDNWLGDRPSPVCQDNVNVTSEDKPATASLTTGGCELTREFAITKSQAPPVGFPECPQGVEYGQRLEDAVLSFDQNEYGAFEWRNSRQVPSADAEEGYDLDFHPYDLQNYDWPGLDGFEDANHEGVMQWVEGENVLRIKSRVPVHKSQNEWLVEPSVEGWVFGNVPNSPEYEARFGDVKVRYAGTANDGSSWDSPLPPIKAGSYTVSFIVEETKNYTGLEKELAFQIAKADYDLSDAGWDYGAPFVYDGSEHEVQVVGLPNGVTVAEYSGNAATELGIYTAKAVLSYDEFNYNQPAVSDLTWSIVESLPDSGESDGNVPGEKDPGSSEGQGDGSSQDSKPLLDPAKHKNAPKSAMAATGDESPMTVAFATTALSALIVMAAAVRLRDGF